MAADPVFLDTNILVAASVAEHPSHLAAVALLDKLTAEQAPLCISPQVCREFLVVLTRMPVSGRAFTVAEALEALDTWRSACVVVEEGAAVLVELLALVRDRQVRGKQVHDANIVATMRSKGITRLATLNAGDFERHEDDISIEALVT
ncbi:MAG TPA: TA system VapC family ribonuclease toxin [Thermoleophilia bacterium]|nr:TA system VapC family ribonuclease toxin [Thermoleophilia bacterium]